MKEKISSVLKRYNYIEGAIDEQYHQMATDLGLSDSAFNILYVLYQEGDGCGQSTIYRMSGMSRKTAGSSLQRLEEEGIITISRTVGKKSNTVFLTQKGRELIEQKIIPIVGAENEVFYSWTPWERETFLALSNRYLHEITERFEDIRKSLKAGADGGREP